MVTVTQISEEEMASVISSSVILEEKVIGSSVVLRVEERGQELVIIQNPMCGTYIKVTQ